MAVWHCLGLKLSASIASRALPHFATICSKSFLQALSSKLGEVQQFANAKERDEWVKKLLKDLDKEQMDNAKQIKQLSNEISGLESGLTASEEVNSCHGNLAHCPSVAPLLGSVSRL